MSRSDILYNGCPGPRSGPVPLAELAAAGVRRVSLGGALYRRAMAGLEEAAMALRDGDLASGSRGIPAQEIAALLP